MKEKIFMFLQGYDRISSFENEINHYLELLDKDDNVEEYETNYYTTHDSLYCIVTSYYLNDEQ